MHNKIIETVIKINNNSWNQNLRSSHIFFEKNYQKYIYIQSYMFRRANNHKKKKFNPC